MAATMDILSDEVFSPSALVSEERLGLSVERPVTAANDRTDQKRTEYWNPFSDEADGECVFSSVLPVSKKEDIRLEAAPGFLRLHIRKFIQTFSLPFNSDIDAIRADYKDGLLKVRVPCLQEAEARIIPIDEG